MKPRGKTSPKKGTGANAKCPVDEIIDNTITRHAEEARGRREQSERIRLGPRRRIAKGLLTIVQKELKGHKGNGLSPSPAVIVEQHAKQIAKELGLESQGKKDP